MKRKAPMIETSVRARVLNGSDPYGRVRRNHPLHEVLPLRGSMKHPGGAGRRSFYLGGGYSYGYANGDGELGK